MDLRAYNRNNSFNLGVRSDDDRAEDVQSTSAVAQVATTETTVTATTLDQRTIENPRETDGVYNPGTLGNMEVLPLEMMVNIFQINNRELGIPMSDADIQAISNLASMNKSFQTVSKEVLRRHIQNLIDQLKTIIEKIKTVDDYKKTFLSDFVQKIEEEIQFLLAIKMPKIIGEKSLCELRSELERVHKFGKMGKEFEKMGKEFASYKEFEAKIAPTDKNNIHPGLELVSDPIDINLLKHIQELLIGISTNPRAPTATLETKANELEKIMRELPAGYLNINNESTYILRTRLIQAGLLAIKNVDKILKPRHSFDNAKKIVNIIGGLINQKICTKNNLLFITSLRFIVDDIINVKMAKAGSVLTMLHFAVEKDKPRRCGLLIALGADVNVKDNTQLSALEIATTNEVINPNLLLILIQNGARLKGLSENAIMTILLAMINHPEVFEKTLTEKFKSKFLDIINSPNVIKKFNVGVGGYTYMHSAAARSELSLIKILSYFGSDINQKADDGETPLHIAVWDRNFATVEFLIQQGANVLIKDNNDKTALDHAKDMKEKTKLPEEKANLEKIIKLLKEETSKQEAALKKVSPPKAKKSSQILGFFKKK